MNSISRRVPIVLTIITILLHMFVFKGYSSDLAANEELSVNVKECVSKIDIFEQLNCYISLAVSTNNQSICDKTNNESIKYQCIAIFAGQKGDWKICEQIPQSTDDHKALREICLSDVAVTISRPKLCASIKSQGLRDGCYLKISKKTGDQTLCGNISDPGLKSLCNGKAVNIK